MKRLLLLALLTGSLRANAQLSAWQAFHKNKVMFFPTWMQTRVDEGDADVSNEIELGDDFWLRAYIEDDVKAKVKDKVLDLRISCDGVSVTLHELSEYTSKKFIDAKGYLPSYAQMQDPLMPDAWKGNNIFSTCGMAPGTYFEQKEGSGCLADTYYAESLLRFLLSKIDDKVIPGAVLIVKYELVAQAKDGQGTGSAEFETLAEGPLKLEIPAKEKAILSQLYHFYPTAGMSEPGLEERIKQGVLALTTGYIKDIQKIQVISRDYNIDKDYNGVLLDRWLQVRIVYSSPLTNEHFTSLVNVVFSYNGSGYETEVHNVFFQCGNTFVPGYAVPN